MKHKMMRYESRYAYTLQGWLNGINSTSVGDGSYDIGTDGKIGSGNNNISRDAFGFNLNYFSGDYKPIGGSTVNPFALNGFSLTNVDGGVVANPLYNGNIASMMVSIPKLGEALTYGYKYDQLNRIKSMDAFKGLDNANNIFTPASTGDYKERADYDANGNIQAYTRNGTTQGGGFMPMDNLAYMYKPGTNQLDHVTDAVSATNYSIDIDNQDTLNYTYDQICNLTKDVAEGITDITWTVYGKINSISKSDGTIITYSYDVSGNRISKIVNNKETWYVRDASGNVLSVYSKDGGINSGHLTQSEINLYGSSRLGTYNEAKDVQNPDLNTGRIYTFTRGNKFFELSSHLGNVLVTISNKKAQHSTDGTMVDYYIADLVSAQDYYPGGMDMPGRSYSITNTNYRYGFNGKEKDNKDGVVQYDYGFRIYDPRLVRFKSVDPLMKSYPWYTPYQFAGNSTIANIDLDGREDLWFMTKLIEKVGTLYIKATNAGENFKRTISETNAAANNNYGGFDESQKTQSMQEQVQANNLNVIKGKLQIVGQTFKVGGYGAAVTTVVFAAPIAAAALPELFAATGTIQLNSAGSYLVQHTLKAALDAGAQKLVTGEVDWIDVASDYLPAKTNLGKALLTAFQSSVDYTAQNGLQSILGSTEETKKSGGDAIIDAFTTVAGEKLFGRFNKTLEKAFKANGIKGDNLSKAIGEVVKGQSEFIQNTLKAAVSEEIKIKR